MTDDAATDGTGDDTAAGGDASGPLATGETDHSDRLRNLIDELTLGEKRVLIKGAVDPEGIATGYVPPIDRLDVPSCSLVDGPMGIRAVPSTAFPATVSLAASWDDELARRFGETIGTEARGAGQDVLLAPGVNIARVPQCGRNFEYYSEDPALTADLATAMIEGVQSRGVMATVKHYVANNQETDRHTVSAEIPERALREIYLPAYEAAVKDADVASVMAAYNRIDGTHATEHRRLLTEILREEWGFSGFVVSDWWATTDGPEAALAGLDLDMPGMPVYEWQEHGSKLLDLLDALPDGLPKERIAEVLTAPWQPENPNPHVLEESHFGSELTAAIEDGRVTEADLDRMVGRILGQYERFGLLDGEGGNGDRTGGEIDGEGHSSLAREIAERGTILLENDDETLPLDADDLDAVALIGPHADEPKVGGGGSSEVDAIRTSEPAEGLQNALGNSVDVTVERGIDRIEMGSFVESPLPDLPIGREQLGLDDGPEIADAVAAARNADVAVVLVQDAAREGADRAFELPGEQDELISRVAATANRTVVVCKTSGAVAMPWRESVDAIVQAWYPGQADGIAIGNVLAGEADPSGRLPVTVGAAPEDYPASTEARYPGTDLEVEYSEGVFVGYRHFDDADVEPIYPFGHGESYAEFEYGELSVERAEASSSDDAVATVSVTVENVADLAGREVVQCYLSAPGDAVDRPPRELAAFEAIELAAGESRTVELSLDRRDFAYYDVDTTDWRVESGEHEIQVGRSSRDLRCATTVSAPE